MELVFILRSLCIKYPPPLGPRSHFYTTSHYAHILYECNSLYLLYAHRTPAIDASSNLFFYKFYLAISNEFFTGPVSIVNAIFHRIFPPCLLWINLLQFRLLIGILSLLLSYTGLRCRDTGRFPVGGWWKFFFFKFYYLKKYLLPKYIFSKLFWRPPILATRLQGPKFIW